MTCDPTGACGGMNEVLPSVGGERGGQVTSCGPEGGREGGREGVREGGREGGSEGGKE